MPPQVVFDWPRLAIHLSKLNSIPGNGNSTYLTSKPQIVHVVSMLDVPSRFGSTSFQSKDVNGAQKSEFLFWKINDYNYQWRTTIGSYNTGVNCWCLLNVTHCSNIRTFCTISNCEVLYVLCDVIKWRIQFARRPNFPLLTNRGKNQRKKSLSRSLTANEPNELTLFNKHSSRVSDSPALHTRK